MINRLFGNYLVKAGKLSSTQLESAFEEQKKARVKLGLIAVSEKLMTPEQAKTDKRRNLLLQCIGASDVVEPQVQMGKAERGAYMLCSDGFRHEITEKEMFESLNPVNLMNKNAMHSNARYLIDLVKSRNEKDNISVILIKSEKGDRP